MTYSLLIKTDVWKRIDGFETVAAAVEAAENFAKEQNTSFEYHVVDSDRQIVLVDGTIKIATRPSDILPPLF